MAINYVNVDSFQTRVSQAMINLTQLNATTYPATSVIKIDPPDMPNAFGTNYVPVTSMYIYDQWAFKTKAMS
jgi:hypothetical protein